MGKDFREVLIGKKIPILTLDHKWYKLLDEDMREQFSEQEKSINDLLKRNGKLNDENKKMKRLKMNLMNEIVQLAEEQSAENDAKIEQNKKLVEECNERIEKNQDELLDLPRDMEQQNLQLMLQTMEHCYSEMQENTEEIQEIAEWVKEIRIELKKKLIRKQELEQKNFNIYTYMHDVFGAEVIDLFDMKYNPEIQHPVSEKENK